MPKILTEKSSVLSYVKEDLGKDKHYLGKLAGIGAEFDKPTRNGRRYPLELWRNVENSDDFKEGMATHTIFGECDHPETRVETSIKEIAIVLTKYEIREREGNIYVEFHILDTPNGRILKELLDYGSQIGVSTRGLGDEIERDGEIIIDPDTFVFYAWDAVIMPAVKKARPEVLESKKKQSLVESFNQEIEQAQSPDELKQIQRYVKKLPELDSISESIDIKLKSMEAGNDISAKLESDLGNISEENMHLTEQVDILNKQLVANDIRINRLKSINEAYKDVNKALRNRLTNYAPYVRRIEKNFGYSMTECDNLNRETEVLQRNLNKTEKALEESNRKLSNSQALVKSLNESKREANRQINESKQRSDKDESRIQKLEEEVTTLRTKLSSHKVLESKYESLLKENKALKEQVTEKTKQTEEEKKKSANEISRYRAKIVESNSTIAETLEKYVQVKCAQKGIKVDTLNGLLPKNYNVEDVDRLVNDLADRKMRYDALPFSTLPSNPTKIVESINKLSKEDAQTVAFLQNFN